MTWEFEQELERANRQTLESLHKAACLRFGLYLDGQRKGTSFSQESRNRAKVVDKEIMKYGGDSLFFACEEPYVAGYIIVVSTLNTLIRLDVHTKEGLLRFNTNDALVHMPGFGPKKAEVVSLLKDVLAAEKALEPVQEVSDVV